MPLPGLTRAAADKRYAGRYNLQPTSMLKARKALANVRAGTGFMKLACMGDSTTWGVGGSASGTDRAYRTAYPAYLAKHLNSYFAPAALTMAIPPSKGDVGSTDGRWVAGSGWGLAFGGWGQQTLYQGNSGAAGTLTFTPDSINCDTFDVYYVRNAGLGSLSVNIDGGSNATVSTAGAGAILKTTVTATAGTSHVVNITNSGGVTYVVGIDSYLSTAPGIRVGNCGVSSTRTSDWITSSGGGALQAITGFAPDLTVLMLGINDSKNPVTVATFQTNLATIASTAAASGDVILMSPVPSSATGSVGTPDYVYEAQYRDAAYALAATAGYGFIDINSRFSSYGVSNPAGFMYDTIHPNALGYADISGVVADAIRRLAA